MNVYRREAVQNGQPEHASLLANSSMLLLGEQNVLTLNTRRLNYRAGFTVKTLSCIACLGNPSMRKSHLWLNQPGLHI
eukprot:1160479-Pelagomonas_calceolata.AAC.17